MQDFEEDFKKEMLARLNRACYRSRICKDSSKEHIILIANKRVTINNKSIWCSEKSAQKAIERYIVDGKHWNLGSNSVWKGVAGLSSVPPSTIHTASYEIREGWAKKNLRIMPLRDYMTLEHKRSKASK